MDRKSRASARSITSPSKPGTKTSLPRTVSLYSPAWERTLTGLWTRFCTIVDILYTSLIPLTVAVFCCPNEPEYNTVSQGRSQVDGKELHTVRRLHIQEEPSRDRKSTRLNSSHSQISYAVFCLKK